MADSINWANSYSYDGLRGLEATRNARNILAEEMNNQIKTGNFADKVNVASDIMGLAEKGRQFNEKINAYAQKVNRTPPLSESERAPEENVVGGDTQSDAEESRGLLSRAFNVSEETAEKIGKWGTKASIIGTAGIDLMEDIQEGGVKGNNFAQETENLGNIVGGVLETAGMVVPALAPELELGGVVISGIGDIIGDIGDLVDNHAKTEDLQKQKEHEQLTPATGISSVASQILTAPVS
jgi:hypothetical protein